MGLAKDNKMLRNSNRLFVISGIALLTLATLYFGSRDQLLALYTQHRYFQTKPSANVTKPHILFIVADDLGFHDVGYHGSAIKTPNLDKLALSGVRLENYYVQPICSPTRGQLLTGRYQIHTGFQWLLWPATPLGLSLDNPTIADKLREAGYATHIVGKWHLGFMNKRYLPTYRGFDTYFGFLSGHSDYFSHKTCDWKTCGYDLMENDVPANITKYKGVYSTFLFRDKVKEIIRNHDLSKPLFIYLPFQAVHAPNQVPERYLDLNASTDAMVKKGKYTGLVTCMDEAIGDIVETVKSQGMWENTVLIFTTDNGGDHRAGSSNRPLRGHKGNLWEGGIRAVGFIHSMLLGEKISGSVSRALMHVTDWFPTLVKLAGGSLNGTKPLDGYDIWNTIKYGLESPRKEILHDINPRVTAKGKPLYKGTFNTTRKGALRIGNWKIITGYSVSGPRRQSNISEDAANVWLFNIRQDPQENKDLSRQFPEKVKSMLKRLEYYQNGMVPCPYRNKDPRANPERHGGFWGPWM